MSGKSSKLFTLCFAAVTMGVTFAGCGSQAKIKPVADPLPELAKPITGLDEGRVEVSPPEGWRSLGATRGTIARFALDFDSLPRIWIQASSLSDAKLSGFENVTAGNIHQLANQVSAALATRSVKVVEPVLAMSVGDRHFVRYVLETNFSHKGRKGGRVVTRTERQVLVTVLGGRVYTVDLHVPPKTMRQHRSLGYSVMKGLVATESAANGGSGGGQPPVPNRHKNG